MKYKKIFTKLLKNPIIIKEICEYVKNDFLSGLKIYRYEHNILFVAGLPKSGSSWVGNMLAMVPGYNLRSINDPQNKAFYHDVCESIFSSLPKKSYSVMKLHTKCSGENLRIIRKYVKKVIITYRDLRDMCVSRYFHIKVDPRHPDYRAYNDLSLEDGISRSIDAVGGYYVSWVKDWLDAALSDKDTFLTVKYEDLNRETHDTLKRILEFCAIRPDAALVDSLASTRIKKEADLEGALKRDLPGKLRSSARKGIVGEWKDYFNGAHKAKFKKVAGDLLIGLGYEKDFNW